MNSSGIGNQLKHSFDSDSATSDNSMMETIDVRIFKGFVRQVCDETNINFGNNRSNRLSLDYDSCDVDTI